MSGYGTDAIIYLKALSSESIEKLPVFNKSAFKHYQMSSEADDWCIPSKEPKNLSKEKLAVWGESRLALYGIKVGLRQCCFVNVCGLLFPQNKAKQNQANKKQTLEQTLIWGGTELGYVTGRSQGRAPVDNKCPASHLAMQNDSWLFQILKRSLPLSYIFFSTSTGFEVCSFNRWMF